MDADLKGNLISNGKILIKAAEELDQEYAPYGREFISQGIPRTNRCSKLILQRFI